jgi:hypothetical protein
MNYGFHPAAEAEYLEQIAFYEACQRGLGARYRDYFLRTIRKVCEAPTQYPIEQLPDIRRVRLALPVDNPLSGAKCNDPSARRHTLPSSAGLLARAHYLDEGHVERQSAARRLSSGQVFHVVLLTRS